MKSKRGIVVTALLSAALLIPTTPSSADSKEIQVAAPDKKVKCKVTKASAQSPMRIPAPENLMKRAPKFLTLQTNCGNIVIETFAKAAPVTITVMSQLARAGYFDKTLCHRLTTEGIFVLQCGDPTASGSGGPTFRYRDENLPLAAENNYPAGSVAMANSGPNTNGSQFFLVYKDTTLGPNYTLWGKIVSGLEIVKYIAQGGVKNGGVDGTPLRTIAIERALTKNS
ncbi:MAG: peptidylprolyl isomerase [Candidatus Nanopelagicaceae bacterium]